MRLVNNADEFERRLLYVADSLKKFSKTGDPALLRLIMRHYGLAIIPLISLADGGRDRGRFVGMLRQLRVNLPEQVIRDRSLLGAEPGKFDSKEFNAGIREGFAVRRTRISAELEMQMTRVSHQKMYPRVRDVDDLQRQVIELIRKGLGKGEIRGGNN